MAPDTILAFLLAEFACAAALISMGAVLGRLKTTKISTWKPQNEADEKSGKSMGCGCHHVPDIIPVVAL
jgi:hypothetical protein